MSEIEKYYNGEIIVDFEEETELEKKYNEVAELYSKAVKKKIEYRKEIERLTKDGYIMIKIQDGKLNKNWQLKHRYIYEKHYGKIPEGYNIIFLDGNRKNTNISNLKLVSKYDDLIMNNNKLFSKDKDITETGTIIANVISETYKKEVMRK